MTTDQLDYITDEAVNISTLKAMARSPLHYLEAVANARKSTPAMDLGTVTHLLVLEPGRFDARVAIWDQGDRRGKAWEAFKEANAGKLIVKPSEIEVCIAMAKAVREHPEASALLQGGDAEAALYWQDAETAIDCKGRVDYIRPGCIVDLKTTRDVSPRAFARQAAALQMHLQLAFYADGWQVASRAAVTPEVYVVAVESAAPHDVAVYRVGPEVLDAGRREYRRLLNRLAACVESGEWPGVAPEVVDLELPAWAAPEVDEEIDLSGVAA